MEIIKERHVKTKELEKHVHKWRYLLGLGKRIPKIHFSNKVYVVYVDMSTVKCVYEGYDR